MSFFANYGMSRYAAVEYGVRGAASYVASTGDAVTSGDAGGVFAQCRDQASGVVTASDMAVSFFFEPINIFLLELEQRVEKLLTDIREIEMDEQRLFTMLTQTRTEKIFAQELGQARAENRQAQAQDDGRGTSLKSDSRNFKA